MEAPNKALSYAILFVLTNISMQWADCCVDALLTQKSMLEDEKNRGKLIATIKIVQKLGGVVFALFFAFAFNKVAYGGRFCSFGLEFNHMALVVAVGCLFTLVYVILFTNERDIEMGSKSNMKENIVNLWRLVQKSHFLKLLVYRFAVSFLFGINVSSFFAFAPPPPPLSYENHYVGPIRAICPRTCVS